MPVSASPGRHDANADLLRVLACFFVVAVHFFLSTQFYDHPLTGGSMFFILSARNLFMICVPLFMLLSGYLCTHFVYDLRHLLRYLRVLVIYALSSVICLLFRGIVMQEHITLKAAINHLLFFTGAPYAWYVEMYLGLLLIIPFLNAAWRTFGKKHKQLILLIFLALSATSTIIPQHSFFSWWARLYPIALYLTGAYLHEYRPTLRKRIFLPLLVIGNLLFSALCFFYEHGQPLAWSSYSDTGSFYISMGALLFFCFVLQIDMSRLPPRLTRLIIRASRNTLPAYLLSYCFDQLFYPLLNRVFPSITRQWPWFFLITPVIFVLSLLAGYAVTWCAAQVMRFVRRIVIAAGKNHARR